jgi:hypothetical protein
MADYRGHQSRATAASLGHQSRATATTRGRPTPVPAQQAEVHRLHEQCIDNRLQLLKYQAGGIKYIFFSVYIKI